MTDLNKPEPAPETNDSPAVWDLVVQDMKDRDNEGFKKYGTRLQAGNGRNALIDAYQEVLDLAVYLRQRIEEDRLKDEELDKIHEFAGGKSGESAFKAVQRMAREDNS